MLSIISTILFHYISPVSPLLSPLFVCDLLILTFLIHTLHLDSRNGSFGEEESQRLIHEAHVRMKPDKDSKGVSVHIPKGILNSLTPGGLGLEGAQTRPDCIEMGFISDKNGSTSSSSYTAKTVNGSGNGYSNGNRHSNGIASSSSSGVNGNGDTNGNSSSRLINSNGCPSSNSSSSNSSESGYVVDTAKTSLCNGHNNGSTINSDYGNNLREGKLIGWRGETREWEAPHTFTVKQQLWQIWQTVQLKAVWRPMVSSIVCMREKESECMCMRARVCEREEECVCMCAFLSLFLCLVLCLCARERKRMKEEDFVRDNAKDDTNLLFSSI